MSAETTFVDLMDRVGRGDQDAAAEFFRDYFGHLLTVVRQELRSTRRRHLIDSFDVAQSVLMGFYKGVARGEIHLDQPAQLQGLVNAMVRNKVANYARRQFALRRDVRRDVSLPVDELNLPAPACDPGDEAASNELYAMFYARLTVAEQELFNLRREGRSWSEIATAVGSSPDATRMCVARFLARLDKALDLGLSRRESDIGG